MNDDESTVRDRLNEDGDVVNSTKYKDPYCRLCSARWRTALCIFFAFVLLYMHRVNLSLAIVCMVDTTHVGQESHHKTDHTNGSDLTNNASEFEVATDKNVTGEDQDNGTYIVFINATKTTDAADETTRNDMIDSDSICGTSSDKGKVEWHTEKIHWSKAEISILLSAYFYGSFFTQIPAGTLADKYGGKHIITATIGLSGACALVTPICARTSLILMFVVRILLGLAGGAVIPAAMSMINKWAIPRERPVMIAFCGSGLLSGTIFTYLTSGLLCVYGFDNGWPSIFYLHGGVSVLFVLVWCCTAYSSPSSHPNISEKEIEHIRASKGDNVQSKQQTIPWLCILTSKPMWASIISHFCFNWSFFTVLINVPLFLKEVLKFEIKSNGVYSSLPYVFQIISSIVCSTLSEIIIKRHIHFHLLVRRSFNTISLVGVAGCLVLAGYVTCESRYLAVVLLCLSCVFGGFAYGGFFANHAEYSGRFAGTTFGITNAAGVISSILASMMAGLLTPNGLQEEWQKVFYLAAGVNILGAAVFAVCSDVYIQNWARNQTSTLTIEVDEKSPAQELAPLNNRGEPTS